MICDMQQEQSSDTVAALQVFDGFMHIATPLRMSLNGPSSGGTNYYDRAKALDHLAMAQIDP